MDIFAPEYERNFKGITSSHTRCEAEPENHRSWFIQDGWVAIMRTSIAPPFDCEAFWALGALRLTFNCKINQR